MTSLPHLRPAMEALQAMMVAPTAPSPLISSSDLPLPNPNPQGKGSGPSSQREEQQQQQTGTIATTTTTRRLGIRSLSMLWSSARYCRGLQLPREWKAV